MFVTSAYWKKTRLTRSGRPELIDDGTFQENDILIQSNVGLYQDTYKLVKYQKGKVYLTSKRIIYVDGHPESGRNIELQLIDIDDISIYNGFLKSSPKVILKMRKKKPGSVSNGKETRHVTEVNWICQICSFSNSVRSDLKVRSEADVPPCKNCGMKPPIYLIEGTIRASQVTLTQPNNVVSQEGFQCPTCTFINDVSLKNCEMCGSRLVSSNLPPQLLHDESIHDKGLRLELEGGDASTSNVNLADSGEIDPRVIKLSFRKGGFKTFAEKLVAAKDQAIWEHLKANSKVNVDAVQQLPTQHPSTKQGARFGIQGLQNQRELRSYENSMLLNNSLQDLENLMEKAKDLIQLSNSYQRVLAKDRSNNSKINDTANIISNSKNSVSILNNIITKNEFVNTSAETSLLSSLRKKSKDSDLYIEELSRQVYEFLVDSDVIAKNHGLITLFDLFIIYNRARGINLISPSELFKSVKLFETFKFKYIMFEVPLISKSINDVIRERRDPPSSSKLQADSDKFYIISNKDFTFSSIYQKILRFIEMKQTEADVFYGLSILEIQKNPHIKLNVNYLILNQVLLECSTDGRLCVDATIEGNFFYNNEILKFDWEEYLKGNDRVMTNSKEEDPGISNWIAQNGVDGINYNYKEEDDEEEEEDDDQDEESTERDMSPPDLNNYSFNYRLGGMQLKTGPEEDSDDDDKDIHTSYKSSVNSTLQDLQGLQF